MEIKAELQKPYSENERIDFIIEQNRKNGYTIEEADNALLAWGYTEEEKKQKKKEQIAQLHLTRGDVFRALLLAKGVTRTQLRAIIENLPEENQEQSVTKEMALIDFDEALEFYRGVALIETVGEMLGITSEQMDKFFETNDYKELITIEPEPTGEPTIEPEPTEETENDL